MQLPTQWWYDRGHDQGAAWRKVDWQNLDDFHEILAEARLIDDRMWRLGTEMTAFLLGLSHGLGFFSPTSDDGFAPSVDDEDTLSKVEFAFSYEWKKMDGASSSQ